MTTTTRAAAVAHTEAHGHGHAQDYEHDFLSIHLSPGTARALENSRGARTTLSHFDDSDDSDDEHVHTHHRAPSDLDADDYSSVDDHDTQSSQEEFDPQTPTAADRAHIPLHPIPSMQEAFAESLEEATKTPHNVKPQLRSKEAKQRREKLLDEDRSQGPPNRLWRFRPGQKCHELRKLIAQISFGVELLIKGMANSNAQVLSILQGHIDEVDEFLETAMEDVREATVDLKERLDFLKVPMENMETFEQMLENREFRLQIVEGNVKIEHILSRTSTAHTQTIRDVSEGLRAIREFSEYLIANEHGPWRKERADVVDVFDAMKGNTEGWYNAFILLESNSTLLSGMLVQLSTVIVDIDKKAGEVSRKTRFTLDPYSSPDGRAASRSSDSPAQATPPPSPPAPPASRVQAPPRINSLLFEKPGSSLLEAPDSPVFPEPPPRNRNRITKDSDTLRDTMLPPHLYTPPESSKAIPEVVFAKSQASKADSRSESRSVVESEASEASSSITNEEHVHDLFLLQPRTYTPVPPAPIPSPRVIATAPRGTPDELSIHIELEEDMPQSPDAVRETVLTVSRPEVGQIASVQQIARPLQVPVQTQGTRQSRSSDKEVVLGHKTSLRDRVSLKEKLPTAIHVPPVNAYEIQRPRYPTPQTSPQGDQRPPGTSHSEMDRPRGMQHQDRHHTTHLDFSPPQFPTLIPSPASERQTFRPVQASPHSPLQQRPHTAGTVHRPSHHQRNAPSQMGMSMLSSVTTMAQDQSGRADSTRTVKKKRSAFGWLKKAFSLDEEERAAFEARKRAQPVNHYQYQAYPVQSPRYLDGKRIA